MLDHARRRSAVSCAIMAEPIDFPFGLWTRVGRRTHKFIGIRQVGRCALMGGHLDTTRRILLNRPSAAAMRPCVKLLWLLVFCCRLILEA